MAVDLFERAPLAWRAPISKRTSLGASLALSVFLHLAIAWRLTFGAAEAARGEDGYEGAGGGTFEVTMQGDEAPETHPAIGEDPVIATMPAPPHTRPRARTIAPRVEPDSTSTSTSTSDATSTSDSDGSSTSVAAAGTGDEATDSGRLRGRDDPRLRALLQGSVGGALGGSSLGNVALLEEAARCPDPVAGTWTAHRYSPEFRDWAHFTLSITRDGDQLSGTIHTRMWRGMPSDRHPPPCTAEGWDYTVEMSARGAVHGQSFSFGAHEHHISHIECRSRAFGYNPDHFTGTFDIARDQLSTVNNDGGRDVNAVYTFRRSSCQP